MPTAAALRYSSRGKVPASSHALTCGAISRSTKARTVRRNSSCSGLKYSGAGRHVEQGAHQARIAAVAKVRQCAASRPARRQPRACRRPTHPLVDGDHPMTRVFNFSAGPAALPEPVLRQAAEEMLDWHGSGMSVMEMSHRGKEFIAIHAEAESLLRELLAVPANYKVLFMQGGAIGENAIVPMNMLRGKASGRLHRHRRVVEEVDQGSAASTARSTSPPAPRPAATPASRRATSWKLDPNAAYVHICSQRDHRRRRVPLDARRRQRAAGGRHVEQHPVAPGRRVEVRPDLRRRAEEHRPGRA